jgi:hypothetical protein
MSFFIAPGLYREQESGRSRQFFRSTAVSVAFGTVSLDRGKTVRVDVSQDVLAKIGDTPPKTKAKQLADRPGFSDYKTMLDVSAASWATDAGGRRKLANARQSHNSGCQHRDGVANGNLHSSV